MKKILRRVKLNLLNKTTKFALKCVVFLLFYTLLFTSIYIDHTSKQLEYSILKNYDIHVEIDSDILDKRWSSEISIDQYHQETKEYSEMYQSLSESNNTIYSDLSIRDSSQIISSTKIDQENYYVYYDQGDNDNFIYELEVFNESCQNKDGLCSFVSSTDIKSTSNIIPLDFKFGINELVNGRMFTKEEIEEGKAVCLVPVALREYSIINGEVRSKSIKVGDTITVSVLIHDKEGIYYYKPYEFEVIGTFFTKDDIQRVYKYSTYFIPDKQFEDIFSSAVYELNNYPNLTDEEKNQAKYYEIDPMIFQFDNIDQLTKFLNDLEEYDYYFPETYQYYSTIDEIYPSISNVLAISKTIRFISLLCLIVCIVVSILMILLDINSRKKEIGILLAMGETMIGVVIQFAIELLIVLMVSASCSYFITYRIGNKCMNYLVEINASKQETNVFLDEDYKVNIEDFEEILTPAPLSENITTMSGYLGLIYVIEIGWIIKMIMKVETKDLMKDD